MRIILIYLGLFLSLLPYRVWSRTHQRCLIIDAYTDEVGLTVTDKIIEQLNKNQWLETTKSLTLTEIQDRIERYIARHNPKADVKLSEQIIRVAQATQIDPFVFTSLIKSEATFKMDAKSHTGALGLTQMTQVAFQELRDQLGVGDPQFNPRARDHFIAMIYDYYRDDYATRRFIDFIASTKNRQNDYHVLTNLDYSLLSGALLLKLKLAHSNGDYRKALERYNGSTDKGPYATGILNSTKNGFQSVSLNCIRPDFSDPIIGDTCEISKDSSFCYRYLGIITL